MPTRKPKRTNWKQEAGEFKDKWRDQLRVSARLISERDTIRELNEEIRKSEQKLIIRAESAERHNAELLKEREEWEHPNCSFCNQPAIRRPETKHCCTLDGCLQAMREYLTSRLALIHKPSWLRRNWVELTVMAVVLGAIGFVVWRAWR